MDLTFFGSAFTHPPSEYLGVDEARANGTESFFAGCAAPKSATIIAFQTSTCAATPGTPHSATIVAGTRAASSLKPSSRWSLPTPSVDFYG